MAGCMQQMKEKLEPLRLKIDSYFKISERKSTIAIECRAGMITFLTMAYILPVNAAILMVTGGNCDDPSDLGSTCVENLRIDLIYATAIASGVACLFMGFSANLPFALAPGMGINAYFAFDVVGFGGSGNVNFDNALFATFLEGVIFLILSLTGVRNKVFQLVPSHIKLAMTAGIGMFLAHIGFQSAEGIALITADGATLVNLGGCKLAKQVCDDNGQYCACDLNDTMEGATTWIGIFGLLTLAMMLIYKIKGAVFWCVMIVTVLSWFKSTPFTYFNDSTEDGYSARFDYFSNVVKFHSFKQTPFALFSDVRLGNAEVWVALFTLLYNDSIDTAGTLFSMAEYLNILKEDGSFPGGKAAFASDAVGTIVGAMLGTSTVTTFIESGSGINEGGKTGLVAIVVGLLFFSAVLFSPIWASIPPWATGPALIAVGAMMVKSVLKINWDDMRIAFPAFITMILMPLTYSISSGIIGGIFVHVFIVISDYIIQNWFPDIKCCLRDYSDDNINNNDNNNNDDNNNDGKDDIESGKTNDKTSTELTVPTSTERVNSVSQDGNGANDGENAGATSEFQE